MKFLHQFAKRKMINETITLSRNRVDCILNNMARILKTPEVKEVQLKFTTDDKGERWLTLEPLYEPTEIKI